MIEDMMYAVQGRNPETGAWYIALDDTMYAIFAFESEAIEWMQLWADECDGRVGVPTGFRVLTLRTEPLRPMIEDSVVAVIEQGVLRND